jgi:hypothetical protein
VLHKKNPKVRLPVLLYLTGPYFWRERQPNLGERGADFRTFPQAIVAMDAEWNDDTDYEEPTQSADTVCDPIFQQMLRAVNSMLT